MTEPERLDRNARMLLQCYPSFRDRLSMVLWDLQGEGFRPRIQEAWRSESDQLVAFQAGRSKLRFGMHNVTNLETGLPESLAADVLDDDFPLEPRRAFIFALAGLSRARGLETGILWGLNGTMSVATSQAILARPEGIEAVKIGWDPCHVQAVISVAAARAGARPA